MTASPTTCSSDGPGQTSVEQDLLARGWKLRFTTQLARADESVDLYRAMGYEVRVEPLQAAEFDDSPCGRCAAMTAASCAQIFTRPGADR